MAQVVITDQQVITESLAMWARTIVLGAIVGIAFWLVTLLIGHYIVEPMVCRQVVSAEMCVNATPLAGNIAAVLVAVASIFAMVRLGAARPIIIAVASAALLWNLAAWTEGLFWVESLAWSIGLYALSYALFAWITRHSILWATIVLSVLIVLVIRIALIL